MTENIEKIGQAFQRRFGFAPAFVACAPGRVNLIGEHTDYTGGLVLPVAIDREILFAVKSVPGNVVRGYSVDFDEAVEFKSDEFDPEHPCHWLRYVLGVLREVSYVKPGTGGFYFCVMGTVPMGSGLSSSAAIELATLTAMKAMFDFTMTKKDAALLCQRAENEFVGVKCGIMDQFISSAGVKDHAVKIDCRDLSSEAIKVNTPGHTWLVIDSKKKRGLVDSEYNFRRSQCQAGLAYLQSAFPARKIANLRDISLEQLETVMPQADPVIYKRIKHVISENERVLSTCRALKNGDLKVIGENLYASHYSLKDDFEVSCPELDALVEIVRGVPGAIGARLTGAGFGGCAIALVKNEAVAAVTSAIRQEYPKRFPALGQKVEIWPIRISDGAKIVASNVAPVTIAG